MPSLPQAFPPASSLRLISRCGLSLLLVSPLLLGASAGCGGDEDKPSLVCGAGTLERAGQCVVGGGAGGVAGASAGGTAGNAGAGGGKGGGAPAGGAGGGAGGTAGAAGNAGSNAAAGIGGASGASSGGAGGNVATGGAGGSAGSAGSGPVGDASPPSFAGVSAVAPSSSTSLFVAWQPASDDVSPASRIAYRIFASPTKGAHDFAKPTAIAPPGSASAELFVGITSNTDYYVVVRAVDEAGNVETNTVEKSTKTASDKVAPTFAGIASATTAGPAAVQLAWKAASDDLTPAAGIVYYIYGSQTSGKKVLESLLAVSEPGATSFLLKNLPDEDKLTYFSVRARDGAGNVDANVKEASAFPGKDTTPPTFAGCSGAVTNAAGGIDVLWEPGFDDGTAEADLTYEVWASTVPELQNFASPPNGKVVGGTSVTISGLLPSTDYYVVCRARDASGNQDKNLSQKSARTPADAQPPTFAGLAGIANVSTTTLDLTWAPASDDVTDEADIVYDAYQAKTSGAQDFGAPTKSSAPGATSLTITGLSTGEPYFFVVRARDKAGNRDTNVAEQTVKTAVSFKLDVQPIFNASCALQGCHTNDGPASGLILSNGFAYADTVNVNASNNALLKRVLPGLPGDSYLFRKISNTQGDGTGAMPPSGATPLTQKQKDVIYAWIFEGARNN